MPVTPEDLKGSNILIDFDDYQRTDPMQGLRTSPDQPPIGDKEEEINNSDATDTNSEEGLDEPDDQGTDASPDAPETTIEESAEPNLYYFIQEELKKDGFIDPEMEFDEKVDGMAVFNAYKESLEKKALPEIQAKAHQALLDDGYDPEDLLFARAIRQGVDHRLLSDVSRYEIYSKLDETTPDESKAEVISQMYRDRGYSDHDIKKLVSAAQQDEEVDDLFVQSKEYFGQKFNDFKIAETQRAAAQREQQRLELKKAEDLITKVTTTYELMGEKLTKIQAKELNDAIRIQSETVELDGKQLRATELQKFILDFENDPEFRLYAFKMFKFRNTDKEDLKKEVKKEVESEFLSGYKQKVLLSKEASKNSAVAKEIDKQQQTRVKEHRIEF